MDDENTVNSLVPTRVSLQPPPLTKYVTSLLGMRAFVVVVVTGEHRVDAAGDEARFEHVAEPLVRAVSARGVQRVVQDGDLESHRQRGKRVVEPASWRWPPPRSPRRAGVERGDVDGPVR